MNRGNNVARDLAKLEEAQKRAEERLLAQQKRINKRFDRIRERVSENYGEPNDNQQRIIDAALNLLDREGLNDLSLRKLGSLLDMQAPALYWHFKNKSVLIDYMAEAILQSEFKDLQPRLSNEPWQDWLVHICQRLRRAMLSRRDGARIVAGAHLFPAITLLRIFETTQESLISAGVDPKQADLVATTVIHLTFGRVIEEQSSPGPEELKEMDLEEMRREFPWVAETVKRTLEEAKNGYDEFEASLRLVVGYPKKP
jgi:TetR/AcrR family tetracycline transcriptional repressor